MSTEPHGLTTAQTAAMLGVKPATVYAYVSRGLLTRTPGPDRRSSVFERAEVARLAEHNRHGGRAGSLDVILDTEMTLLEPSGALYYRGRDATRLARDTSYERVAELLWDVGAGDWAARPEALAAGRAAQEALPAGTPPADLTTQPVSRAGVRPADRLRVTAAVVAGTDPLRHDRRPEAVADTGRALIAALVDCLPRQAEPADTSIAARLLAALAATPATPERLRAVNAALILAADHELSASALATRVAASVLADPYLTVLAGLATLGGQLHGGTNAAVEAMLARLATGEPAATLVAERLSAGVPVPGFGHSVYTGVDPRAGALLPLIAATGDGAALAEPVTELIELVGRHNGPRPNLDLTLGLLSVRCGLLPGSGEALFSLARVAGLIGHTIEEYRHRFRFRPRAVYVGRRHQGTE